MAELALVEPPEDDEDEDAPAKKADPRDKELCNQKRIREKLLKLFDDIDAGFNAQSDRANDIMDYWDAYKCQLGGRQYYNGDAKFFLPILSTAIKARMTRFTNQCFPQSGRNIDAVTENGDIPYRLIALLEHYIRVNKLKNRVVRPTFKSGDLEGNYSWYVDWSSVKRHVVMRGMKPVEDEGDEHPEYGDVEDMQEETITDAAPRVEVISDNDLLILPVTASSVADAIERGGSVSIRHRWTKATIELMMDEGDIDKTAGAALLDSMSNIQVQANRDVAKKIAEAAGIRIDKGGKYALVCETWTKLKVKGVKTICRAYYGGDDILLGCKINPYWCDRVPVISGPVDRDAGVLKGRAPAADAIDLQVYANDCINQVADVSNLAAMPIVMADPEKNPKSSTMVLGLGAVWDVDPTGVQFAQFPPLYKDLLDNIAFCKNEIFQILGVNPAMLPQSTGSRTSKRNQAEIALELQVDVLTTAEATSIMEDNLNELLQWFVDLDHQFRDKAITVHEYGPMGRKANMEMIEPIQRDKRIEFVWLGVEQARNAAMAQQQISFLATVMKIPPDKIPGYKIDLSAALLSVGLTQLGARLAPLTLVSLADQQSMDADEENGFLADGYDMPVNPGDDDLQHLQIHLAGAQQDGDPSGTFKLHIDKHNMQRMAKATAQAQQMQKSGGQPGGGTQPGAQPGGGRPGPRVPGAINEDRMPAAGAPQQPRKT